MKHNKKFVAGVLLSVALPFSAMAETISGGPSSLVQDRVAIAGETNIHPAQALVEKAVENMVFALKADQNALQKNPALLFDLLEKNVTPYFDFEKMSRTVLGRYWHRGDRAQQEQFTQGFKMMLMRTYAAAMLSFSDQKVAVQPVRGSGDNVTVPTKIEQKNGPDVSINYRLSRGQSGQWKVTDVVIEGVSMVVNYRGQYTPLIRRNGFGGLLQRMEQFNRNVGATVGPAP